MFMPYVGLARCAALIEMCCAYSSDEEMLSTPGRDIAFAHSRFTANVMFKHRA